MKLKIFQKGFNYSQDGEGNRLILHLQGCNMKCPWCSNPEGMDIDGALIIEKEWLIDSCCPMGAVSEKNLDRTVCVSCQGRPCTLKRRQKGIRLSYKEYELSELIDECVAAKPMFFDGGGVTLTGGEIGVQFDGVKELLTALGEAGIDRAIESNGSNPRMSELFPLVDEWIMDIKHYDDEIHKSWTGISLKNILRTLDAVTHTHPDVLIRVPLIPGFNDRPEDAKGFAQLFKEHIGDTDAKVEFLAYHEYGKSKYEKCGKEYKMKPGKLAEGTIPLFEAALKDAGIRCIRT